MWNAISLVQIWTRVAVSISYDDNHYTTGPDLLIVNEKKRTYRIVFVKSFKSEKIGKYLELARELKNVMEHEGNGDTNDI